MMEKREKTHKKDFEILFCERLIQKNPDLLQALTCLGDAYTRQGFYQEGLEVDRKLVSLRPEDPYVHYNLACSLCLVGALDDSLQELKKAVLLGYEEFDYILEDPDLKQLRKHHRFDDFFSGGPATGKKALYKGSHGISGRLLSYRERP